jgi:hypothetical protein
MANRSLAIAGLVKTAVNSTARKTRAIRLFMSFSSLQEIKKIANPKESPMSTQVGKEPSGNALSAAADGPSSLSSESQIADLISQI